MPILKDQINKILKEKNLTIYKLNKQIDYDESSLNKAIKLQMSFPDHVIKKILPILEVSKEEFTGWIIADKYSKEAIQIATDELKNKSADKIPVLAKNIDKILTAKNLSRTELSKIIKYDQSGLNKMIAGQISMSKTVILKLAPVLEVNEEAIQGWILANKYPAKILNLALKSFN